MARVLMHSCISSGDPALTGSAATASKDRKIRNMFGQCSVEYNMKCVYVYSIYSQYMYAACTYIYFGVGHSRVLLYCSTYIYFGVGHYLGTAVYTCVQSSYTAVLSM